jgi:hypothetical protein
VLVVGLGLRLIFRSWPQFGGPGAIIGTVGYIAFEGSVQSQALRARRNSARRRPAHSDPSARA